MLSMATLRRGAPGSPHWRHRRARRAAARFSGEAGSGTALSAAILFMPLMMMIVTTSMLTDASRAEQALSATAERVARATSLCCLTVDHARDTAADLLATAQTTLGYNDVACIDDIAEGLDDISSRSAVWFLDAESNIVTSGPVPAGGTVRVRIHCRLRPQVLGGFGIAGLVPERYAAASASIDPYRQRFDRAEQP